jgi:prepilin-type N-terminal cleavage/methylation domain-containing protein
MTLLPAPVSDLRSAFCKGLTRLHLATTASCGTVRHSPRIKQLNPRFDRPVTCERGFTLIEMLVAMSLSLVIGGAAMTFMVVSIDQQNAVSSRTVAARNAETALEQLTRDLRQAMTQNASGGALHVTVTNATTTPPTTTISLSIPTPAANGATDTTPQSVTWSCQGSATSPGTCTRTVGSVAHTEVVGFESFSFTNASGSTLTPTVTDPPYLGITLNVQDTSQLDRTQYTSTPHAVRGSTNPIVVQIGVDLRNEA